MKKNNTINIEYISEAEEIRYLYDINGYKIIIAFTNGIFTYMKYPFSGTYNREQWAILSKIERLISAIETKIKLKEGK